MISVSVFKDTTNLLPPCYHQHRRQVGTYMFNVLASYMKVASILFVVMLMTRRISSNRHHGSRRFASYMHVYYNDIYHVDMPPGHRFPMEKYAKVRKSVQERLSGKDFVQFHPSPLATIEDLALTHDHYYIQRYLTGRLTEKENRAIGFPWSQQHKERTLSSTGGTIAAMHSLYGGGAEVINNRIAAHVAGGTHHAFRDFGEGFCVFSDIACAANVALRDYKDRIKRILILDLDVHQGNGNAVLFANNSRVLTFSMHCSGNYFSEKQESDVDVEVPPETGDEGYLQLLERYLPPLFQVHEPDLIFYQAGVDVLGSDRLGRLKLSREGVRQRNLLVYEALFRYGKPLSKLVITMGGGYPSDADPCSTAYQDIINAHADVYVQAAELMERIEKTKKNAEHTTVTTTTTGNAI